MKQEGKLKDSRLATCTIAVLERFPRSNVNSTHKAKQLSGKIPKSRNRRLLGWGSFGSGRNNWLQWRRFYAV
jgi:hypothetical protein